MTVTDLFAENPMRRFRTGAVLALAVFMMSACTALSGKAAPPAPPDSAAVLFPEGSIRSLETAEQAIAAVAKERAVAEARFKNEELVCYDKFFTSDCVDDAKERRRLSLLRIRPVEVEANYFKRKTRVEERDKALAQQRAAEEAESEERLRIQQQNEIARAKKEADTAEKLRKFAEASGTPAPVNQREIRQQERQQREQAEASADAKKRAENVLAYEKKVKDAKERQQKVAEKKLERERERAARAERKRLEKEAADKAEAARLKAREQ